MKHVVVDDVVVRFEMMETVVVLYLDIGPEHVSSCGLVIRPWAKRHGLLC